MDEQLPQTPTPLSELAAGHKPFAKKFLIWTISALVIAGATYGLTIPQKCEGPVGAPKLGQTNQNFVYKNGELFYCQSHFEYFKNRWFSIQPQKLDNETTNWQTYRNDEYGFEITMTDAWKGYKVFEFEGGQDIGAPTYLHFAMPTSDKTKYVVSSTDTMYGYVAPFTIVIISKDRETVTMTDGSLGEDDANLYGYSLYSHFNELSEDLKNIDFEIPKVISTFKFIEPRASGQFCGGIAAI